MRSTDYSLLLRRCRTLGRNKFGACAFAASLRAVLVFLVIVTVIVGFRFFLVIIVVAFRFFFGLLGLDLRLLLLALLVDDGFEKLSGVPPHDANSAAQSLVLSVGLSLGEISFPLGKLGVFLRNLRTSIRLRDLRFQLADGVVSRLNGGMGLLGLLGQPQLDAERVAQRSGRVVHCVAETDGEDIVSVCGKVVRSPQQLVQLAEGRRTQCKRQLVAASSVLRLRLHGANGMIRSHATLDAGNVRRQGRNGGRHGNGDIPGAAAVASSCRVHALLDESTKEQLRHGLLHDARHGDATVFNVIAERRYRVAVVGLGYFHTRADANLVELGHVSDVGSVHLEWLLVRHGGRRIEIRCKNEKFLLLL